MNTLAPEVVYERLLAEIQPALSFRSGTDLSVWRSEPATVETGLLSSSDWTTRFVSPCVLGGAAIHAPILARTMTLGSGIKAARLYATAHGVYTATVNGNRVGDVVFAPGWTSYGDRLCHHTYDVTTLLEDGTYLMPIRSLSGTAGTLGRCPTPHRRSLDHYGARTHRQRHVDQGRRRTD